MKLGDVTNAILEQLTLSCAECGITSDIITKPSFACDSDSPKSVTYHARLEGTSETDSGSLISLIEEWVGGGASIIVTGVLIRVNSECSVAISSLSEKMCSTTQPPVTNTNMTPVTAAIIGGTVTVLTITFAVVAIILTLILKKHRGKLSISNREEK